MISVLSFLLFGMFSTGAEDRINFLERDLTNQQIEQIDEKADFGRSYRCVAVYEGRHRDRYFRAEACGRSKARRKAIRRCQRNVRYPSDCYLDYCESNGWCVEF